MSKVISSKIVPKRFNKKQGYIHKTTLARKYFVYLDYDLITCNYNFANVADVNNIFDFYRAYLRIAIFWRNKYKDAAACPTHNSIYIRFILLHKDFSYFENKIERLFKSPSNFIYCERTF